MVSASTTLVIGASGATGRRLVEQLLEAGQCVKTVVRSKARFGEIIPDNERLQVVEADVLDMNDSEFQDIVAGCDCVVSCLGHNMNFKGMYRKPRKLVTDSVKKVCKAVQNVHSGNPVKVILMGSNGVANPNGEDDVRPMNERALLSVIRSLVPPHSDNEDAAAYLSKDIGKNEPDIEWVVVRPDALIDGDVSKYDVFDKPQKGLFGGGETTRANVAHFMKDLIMNGDTTWNQWKFQMPVPANEKIDLN
jgi:nucleoside-diphosphate-sugar epimerase